MQETFRLVKGVRIVGFLIVAFCLLLCVASANLLFVDDPFGEGRSGVGTGILGLCVFSPMLVWSCFLLASYYTDRFSIEGNKLTVRSNFQNRQFEVSDIETLRWMIHPNGGCVLFHVKGTYVRLNFSGRNTDDRLRIIRILRNSVPAELQVGWSIFCHKIALRLRDGFLAIARSEPSTPSRLKKRHRYNLLLLIAAPVSLVVAVSLADRFLMREFLALPVLVVAALIFLRSWDPKSRRTEVTPHSRWRNRANIFGAIGILGSTVAMFAVKLCELGTTAWSYLPIAVALASFPPLVFCLMKVDKERLKEDEALAEASVAAWLDGEQMSAQE